jgi:hypothetical protein
MIEKPREKHLRLGAVTSTAVMNRWFTLFREFGLIFVDHLLDIGMVLHLLAKWRDDIGEKILSF